jgi:hypothetical protein
MEAQAPEGKMKSPRAEALAEAGRLIEGDRDAAYGSPTENFTGIAKVLTVVLGHLLKPGAEVSPVDVAAIHVAVKLCRRVHADRADNWIDVTGYGACGYEVGVATKAFPPFDAPPQ